MNTLDDFRGLLTMAIASRLSETNARLDEAIRDGHDKVIAVMRDTRSKLKAIDVAAFTAPDRAALIAQWPAILEPLTLPEWFTDPTTIGELGEHIVIRCKPDRPEPTAPAELIAQVAAPMGLSTGRATVQGGGPLRSRGAGAVVAGAGVQLIGGKNA